LSNYEDLYRFTFGSSGQKSLETLDKFFNTTSEAFILNAGLKPGMRVLDIGCGTGAMSCWLAERLGPEGSVIAIDNNKHQLMSAKVKADAKKLSNIKFEILTAYEINTIPGQMDFVFCRFILHDLFHPSKVLHNVYEILQPNGIFVCEEGITSSAFTYPSSEAWGIQRWNNRISMEDLEGNTRDGNYGMKLFYRLSSLGFKINNAALVQPMLTQQEDKELILQAMIENKKSFLDAGEHLLEWERQYRLLKSIVNDEHHAISFYQSCQVAGQKPMLSSHFESERLRYRLLKLSDTELIFQTILRDNMTESLQDIETLLIQSAYNYRKFNLGMYGIEFRENQQFFGMGGFAVQEIDGSTENILTLKLALQYSAVLNILLEIALFFKTLAFQQLSLTRFCLILYHADEIYTQMMTKIGMKFEKQIYHLNKKAALYSIHYSGEPLEQIKPENSSAPILRFFSPGH